MYATVKEVHDDTVLLEVAPGVHAIYAKNAVGAVLDDAEYNRIVHGDDDELDADGTVVPDDASSLTGEPGADKVDVAKIDLGKDEAADDDAESKDDAAAKDAKGEGKADGETGTK